MFSANDPCPYPVIELGYEKKSFASSLMTPIFTKRALRRISVNELFVMSQWTWMPLSGYRQKPRVFVTSVLRGSQFQHFSLRLEQMAKYVDFWTS